MRDFGWRDRESLLSESVIIIILTVVASVRRQHSCFAFAPAETSDAKAPLSSAGRIINTLPRLASVNWASLVQFSATGPKINANFMAQS